MKETATMNMRYSTRRLTTMATTATLLALVGAASLKAQTWEAILELDSPLVDGRDTSRAIIIDPASSNPALPDLLVAGQADGDTAKLHRLLQATDPVAGVLVALDAGIGNLYCLATVPRGEVIYAAGEVSTGSSSTGWIVRRSLDHGLTWTMAATFSLGGPVAQARGITVTPEGLIVVCGFALDPAGYSHWVVGTSSDGGTTWAYKKVFSSTASSSLTVGDNLVMGLGVAQGADGSLFVVGSRGSKSLGKWTVTKSSDGGNTWSTLDSWVPSGRNGSARARKVTIDRGGRIFVMGDTGSGTESDPSPWVVRMSADGGATWRTIFGPWSYSVYDVNPVPMDITPDANGNVWLAGHALERVPVAQSKGKTSYAYLRTALAVRLEKPANPLSIPWAHSVSAVSPVCEYPSSASSITSDAYGGVYVNGRYRDTATGPARWFVRRIQH